jgi:hypothetical protein
MGALSILRRFLYGLEYPPINMPLRITSDTIAQMEK